MPWIYISDKGFPAKVTDDDANEIALLTSVQTDVSQTPIYATPYVADVGPITVKGMLEARATMDFHITDLDAWMQVFSPFRGG